MSANEDFVRAGFDAFNSGNREAWLAFADPDARFYTAGLFPDFDTVFRGRAGLAEFWDRFHEPGTSCVQRSSALRSTATSSQSICATSRNVLVRRTSS